MDWDPECQDSVNKVLRGSGLPGSSYVLLSGGFDSSGISWSWGTWEELSVHGTQDQDMKRNTDTRDVVNTSRTFTLE